MFLKVHQARWRCVACWAVLDCLDSFVSTDSKCVHQRWCPLSPALTWQACGVCGLRAGATGAADHAHHLTACLLQRRCAAHVGLLHVLLRGRAAVWQHSGPGLHQRPRQLLQLW